MNVFYRGVGNSYEIEEEEQVEDIITDEEITKRSSQRNKVEEIKNDEEEILKRSFNEMITEAKDVRKKSVENTDTNEKAEDGKKVEWKQINTGEENKDSDEYANAGNRHLFEFIKNKNRTEYDNAIEKYRNAIKLNKDSKDVFRCRCIAHIINGSLTEAAKDFLEVRTNILEVLKLPDYKDEKGENKVKKVAREMLDLDKEGVFYKTLKDKSKNRDKYKDIYIQSLEILHKLKIETDEMPVSHYTPKWVSEKLLFKDFSKDSDKPKFRLSSVNTSNDSSEGKVLFWFLFDKEKYSSQIEDYGAFAGCFAFNNDSLNQFRLYGKDQKEEGTGVSITLNEKFFSKVSTEIVNTESSRELSLYRCIYIDPDKNNIVSLGQKEEYVFVRENKRGAYSKYKQNIDIKTKEVKTDLQDLKSFVITNDLNPLIVY